MKTKSLRYRTRNEGGENNVNRVAPDTKLAGYPANFFPRYPAE